jgi:hypothetical protein
LRLEALAGAGRTRTERAVRLEAFLIQPTAFFVAAPEIRDEPFEASAEWILFAVARLLAAALFRATAAAGCPEEQQVANLFRQASERQREVDAERAAQTAQRLANELAIPLRPRGDCAVLQRHGFIRHQACRIEVVDRAEPLALGARAVRRIERERARRHLGHADAAIGTRQAPREQPVSTIQRINHHDVVCEVERDLH